MRDRIPLFADTDLPFRPAKELGRDEQQRPARMLCRALREFVPEKEFALTPAKLCAEVAAEHLLRRKRRQRTASSRSYTRSNFTSASQNEAVSVRSSAVSFTAVSATSLSFRAANSETFRQARRTA